MSFEIDVRKRLGETEVALTLAAGDGATVLFGPSGVGKTSLRGKASSCADAS